MFFKLLKDAFKVKQVRSKILFTIFIVLVFRIGTTITVPGVNAKILNSLQDVSFLEHAQSCFRECHEKLLSICSRC